jgi:ribosomal protein L9
MKYEKREDGNVRDGYARNIFIKGMQEVNRTPGVNPEYKEGQRKMLDASISDKVLDEALDRLLSEEGIV